MSIRILILAASFTLMSNGYAKPAMKKTAGVVLTRAPFKPTHFALPEWNEAVVSESLKASEKKRKPANSTLLDASMMSKEFRSYQARIHAAKTSEKLEEILIELDKNYENLPSDLKFYTNQVLPTMAFRGIFYRLKPLFDGKSSFMHSQVLTTAKSLASKVNIFLPYDHADSGYEYIASPYVNDVGTTVSTFENEQDLQIWMINELLPLVTKSITRLDLLSLVEPIIWDQKLAFGPQSFIDNVNRFKLIGEFEKQLVLSAAFSSVASIATVRAYSIENSIELYKQVGFLYGLDGFGFFNKVDGVSAEKISKEIRKPNFAQTGTLLADGAEWMNYAYRSSKNGLLRLSEARKLSSEDRKDESLYAFNIGYINVNRNEIKENLDIAKRIILSKDVETVRSAVTGEIAQVNFSKIFLSPPQDMKVFLPNSFDKKAKLSRVVTLKDGSAKTINYRNYAQGSATGWAIDKIEPYFPSVKTNEDVYKTVRVINHVQGNWLSVR